MFKTVIKGCIDAIQNRQYISCVLNTENGNEAIVSIKQQIILKKWLLLVEVLLV